MPEGLAPGGTAHKRRQAHQPLAAHACKPLCRGDSVTRCLGRDVQDYRNTATSSRDHNLSSSVNLVFSKLPPFAGKARKCYTIGARIPSKLHLPCKGHKIERLTLVERRLENRNYAAESQGLLQAPVSTTRSIDSPRAKRSRFAAICRARRAIIGAVQPELCGVANTFGSSWNG